jgi:hypothetical protein
MNLKSELSIIKKNWEVKLIEIVGIITEDGGGCVSHTGTHLNSYRKLQPILNLCLLTTKHRQKSSNTIFYNLLQLRTTNLNAISSKFTPTHQTYPILINKKPLFSTFIIFSILFIVNQVKYRARKKMKSEKKSLLQDLIENSVSGCVVTDGGFATHLETLGASINDPLWSAICLIKQPHLIKQVFNFYLFASFS